MARVNSGLQAGALRFRERGLVARHAHCESPDDVGDGVPWPMSAEGGAHQHAPVVKFSLD
jgi:hypothetical protein